MKLKWKIILPVVLVNLLSFSTVAYYAGTMLRSTNLEAVQHDISGTAEVVGDLMNTYFESIREQGALLSALPLTTGVATNCASLDLADPENAKIIADFEDVKQLGGILAATLKSNHLNAAYLLNAKGRIIASHNGQRYGEDLSQRDYYKKYKDSKFAPMFTDAFPSFVTKRPTVSCLYPVYNEKKELLGTFLLSVDYTLFFKRHVQQLKISGSGYPYFLTPEGKVVAHKDESVVDLEKPLTYPFIAEILKMNEGTIIYNFKGTNRIAAVAVMASTGWRCVVSAHLGELTQTADLMVWYIAGLAVVALILAVIVLFLIITYQVNRPINCIVDHLTQFSTGDLELIASWGTYVPNKILPRSDEIGGIGRAIHNLRAYIMNMAEIADRIAAKNLNVEVSLASERDRFGTAFRAMTENLNNAFSRAQTAAAEVTNGAEQVNAAAQSLSQGATEQAASLEEITATITEMGSQARHNAENATQASTLSAQANTAAASGQSQMERLSTSIGDITRKAEEVMKVNKVIDDIAFQTNLLALNAAVEAARAGRHGKGFAVVAEEVRNLAARSAKAAAETRGMIEGVVNEVRSGNAQATATAEQLKAIAGGISKANDLVNEIAAASNEQAQGVMQISQALEQIDRVTQQNTASAEESASASQEMKGQAGQLRDIVAEYQIRGGSQVQFSRPAEPQPHPFSRPKTPRKPLPLPEGGSAGVVRPQQQIILDDSEFGKY